MTAPRPVRWLHLSDLHLGCRGRELWWQVQEEFETSVRQMTRRLGAPDLLLLTGDLTFSGQEEEFEQADLFLAALNSWIREEGGGGERLLIAIPGNHDLVRPKRDYIYKVLEEYHEADSKDGRQLDAELWEQGDASFLEPLFAPYRKWLESRVLPQLEARGGCRVTVSHFPGDLTVELDLGGFPLAVVGLNSTWQQYRKGDFERRLVIPTQQLHAALPAEEGGSPLALFQRCPRSLLLMHHPPVWLARRGREIFNESIYPPGRFDACLHGHLHHGRSAEISHSGGAPRCFFQSPSLFGLEYYGTSQEERAVGCAWGELSPEGVVRVWPLKRVRRGGGQGAFVHDSEFDEDPQGTVIGGWRRSLPSPAPAEADLTEYLEDLLDRTGHITISGIASTSTRGALRHPIENLYTPLTSRGGMEMGESQVRAFREDRVGLEELLPRHDRLLIEGQPGAGKTTFLRLVAAMLAKDLLGEPCPGGGSWRSLHLGLPAAERPRVPVLVRLSELAANLASPEAPRHRHDNRLWLLDLLVETCEENGYPVAREQWERLLEKGEAILLLDGLDEAAEEGLRERLFAIFGDATKKWRCPVVVTSRPLQTAPLREMGFHHATIEPFGDGEIRTFLGHWVAALHTSEAGTPGGEARRYGEALEEAIFGRPRVRRLATNPVMLTSLCVVHWNEGRQLPEGRSRVYRAVIRWLIAARSTQRQAVGFTDLFALRAFARLALAMMRGSSGKEAAVDLEWAAGVVAPLLEREMPGSTDEERRHRARRWLGFECLGSGIVEELAGRRLRFWHLTFQEFLAALQLAWLRDGESDEDDGDSGENWWPVIAPRLGDAQWRETVELFPGTLLDEGGVGRVDLLLERVAAQRGEKANLAAQARVAGILGRLLRPLEVLDYQAPPEIRAAWEEALEESLAIFTPEGARQVPFETRLSAAEALGQGGDPRIEAGTDNFLEVPGLGGLLLGKYPVTVEEYQRFAEEGRGYEERRFWSDEGWQVRLKERWEAPGEWANQLAHPNRPVTGVSFYEAEAYCRWLGTQQGRQVRLPSEEEWERAATPSKGNYPWGENEPTTELANFSNNVGHPTPVGLYPAGDGPYGHSDLAGNVWEWCSNRRLVPWSEDASGRALRGGAWSYLADRLISSCRLVDIAVAHHSRFGFRIAVE